MLRKEAKKVYMLRKEEFKKSSQVKMHFYDQERGFYCVMSRQAVSMYYDVVLQSMQIHYDCSIISESTLCSFE